MTTTLIQQINTALIAYKNCIETSKEEWADKWYSVLYGIQKNRLPSGCGFDAGTIIKIEESSPERIVLHVAYHHINESGEYDGWTEHDIIVRPTFSGIDIIVKGKNRNKIKDYIEETFYHLLTEDYEDG